MADVNPRRPHDYLRRLDPELYRGQSFVHWSMTVSERQTGWLNSNAHSLWREVLLHTLHRYHLAAPVYCLMPDHAHLLLVGLASASDQRNAISFLRKYSGGMLTPCGATWQKQPFDHVLRENERARGAFETVAAYIIENPVRARLAVPAESWPYSGSLVAGWPDLDWRREGFWEHFWTIYNGAVDAESRR